jgi:hypothetical protein
MFDGDTIQSLWAEIHDEECWDTPRRVLEKAAACRALELLGRELGRFKQRHEITQYSHMSDGELDAAWRRSITNCVEMYRGTKEGELYSRIAQRIGMQ